MDDARGEFIAGLRALAQFYETNPDFPMPYLFGATVPYGVGAFPRDEQTSAERFAELVHMLGGDRSKNFDDDYANVTREFGPGVRLQVWAQREQVCTRTQVGTVTEMRPDPNAPQVEVEVPVFAYDCTPVLDDAKAVSS